VRKIYTDIEGRFFLENGCFPDTYLDRLLDEGMTLDKAFVLLQEKLDDTWKGIRAEAEWRNQNPFLQED
jgi:hypothetical protein